MRARRFRRATRRFVAVLVVLLGGALFQAEDAHAAVCTNANHCHAVAKWTVTAPSGFEGGFVSLRTNCMSTPIVTTQSITNEMWIGSAGFNSWVEAGFVYGMTNSGSAVIHPTEFTAAQPDVGGSFAYTESIYSTITTNSYYDWTIFETSPGSRNWAIYVGTLPVITYTSVFTGPALNLQTGVESNSDNGHTYGASNNMAYNTTTGTTSNDWVSKINGIGAIWYEDPVLSNLNRSWVTQYSWMHDGQGATC